MYIDFLYVQNIWFVPTDFDIELVTLQKHIEYNFSLN